MQPRSQSSFVGATHKTFTFKDVKIPVFRFRGINLLFQGHDIILTNDTKTPNVILRISKQEGLDFSTLMGKVSQ